MAFRFDFFARSLLLGLICPALANAAGVTVTVEDGSGAPLKDVLVILQSLDRAEREVCRALTDAQGKACRIEVEDGLYRAIATTPYGLWTTTVTEFLAYESANAVKLSMPPQPTHGFGDIVSGSGPTVEVNVLRPNGEPAVGAEVLVRDKGATLYLERRYKADASGTARIEMVSNPTVVIAALDRAMISAEVSSRHPRTITLRLSPPPRN